MKNKNSEKNIMLSIFVLGTGLIAGFFLTVGNYTAQTKLVKNPDYMTNVIKYEGKIAQCTDEEEKCIKIGSGGRIERLE